jgi:hypothetical protein
MIYKDTETTKRIKKDLEIICIEFEKEMPEVLTDFIKIECEMYHKEMHKTKKYGFHLFEDYLPDKVIVKLYENYNRQQRTTQTLI